MDTQEWVEISYEEARSTLKRWRDVHARRSEEVVEIWEHVLSRYASSLKDELWTILEQVMMAAFDSARYDLAFECLQRLSDNFPNSQRITKLQAIRLEYLGNYGDANYLYDKLLESDPTNVALRKRKIATTIAKGDIQEAITELNEYLHIFVNDSEAWLQLSELFLQDGDFSRAAFCLEELLLTNPNNAVYLCRIADIRYSQGNMENVELAKSYYEMSNRLSPTANALYGIILCCNHLAAKATGARKKELCSRGRTACDLISVLYTSQNHCDGGAPNVHELNPTIERQLFVVERLIKCFSD